MLASIFDNGAVYYPTLLGLPILAGVVSGLKRPDRGGKWIVIGVVAVIVLLDFAFDESRFSDLPFFIVIGIFLTGIGLLARFLTKRLYRPRTV